MAAYHYLTTWCVDAAIGEVFAIIDDPARFTRVVAGVRRAHLRSRGTDRAES